MDLTQFAHKQAMDLTQFANKQNICMAVAVKLREFATNKYIAKYL